MTQAEREARKTLHGQWRTPMPIEFVNDEDGAATETMRFYRGQVRDNVRLSVEKITKQQGDQVHIQRHITLKYYGRKEDDTVDLEDCKYTVEGKANVKYDMIKWDNGCRWTRHGASAKERSYEKHHPEAANAVMMEDPKVKSAPPDFDDFDAASEAPRATNFWKRFQPEHRHQAAVPDWDSKVQEVQKVMLEQLKEVDRKVEEAQRLKEQRDADREAQSRAPFKLAPQATHTAPLPALAGDDFEVDAPEGKVLVADGEHQMMNCSCLCGAKPQVMEDAEGDAGPVEPIPEARDMDKEGFFSPDELDDVIDRINDVVGIWGVSEATEREYIKPPVEAMNKLIAAAMSSFMNNPLMDLISYLMDEAMDFGVKCMKIGTYVKEHFIDPLCAALVDGLEEMFAAVSWIKDQVRKVIMMMTGMVTEQVVTKCVDTVGESDVVD